MIKKYTPAEVLKMASEILQWNLPMDMTAEKLDKVKQIVGAVLTQTHDHLQDPDPLIIINKKVDKPRASISAIADFNKNEKGYSK